MILITTKLKLNQIYPVPPSNDDVVDLSSAQDIDGDKTFHHTIKINAASGYNTGLALINISSERNQRMISGYAGDMTSIIGSIYWNKNFTTNNNRVGLRATKDDGGSYADLYVSINPDGTPITYAPTPSTSDNSTKIATTAYVKAQNYATLASPALTGTPTAPTAAVSTNNTQIATTAFVKNQNYITSNDYARLKSCMVMQSSSTSTNPWYKVCSVLCNVENWDPQITFLVEQTYGSHAFGILRLHLRTNGSKVLDPNVCTITWLINSGFATNEFVLVLPTAASSTAELWTSIPAAWVGRRFSVLSEGTRTDAYQNNWTLYNASSAGQAASITTSGTQIVSS